MYPCHMTTPVAGCGTAIPQCCPSDGKCEKAKTPKYDEEVTAEYKIKIHCKDCTEKIKKCMTSFKGIEKVEIDQSEGKVTVKGVFSANKVLRLLQRICCEKVELKSVKVDVKKKPEVKKVILKVSMHCKACEEDLKKTIKAFEGVHSLKTDLKASTCTVEGTMNVDELIKFLKKKLGKCAKIEPPKKEEKKYDLDCVVTSRCSCPKLCDCKEYCSCPKACSCESEYRCRQVNPCGKEKCTPPCKKECPIPQVNPCEGMINCPLEDKCNPCPKMYGPWCNEKYWNPPCTQGYMYIPVDDCLSDENVDACSVM